MEGEKTVDAMAWGVEVILSQRDRAFAKLDKIHELREELSAAGDTDPAVQYIVRRLNDALDG